MRTLTTPRDRNPYQELLHAGLDREGVEPAFLPMPTPSRTLNVLLVPATLLVERVRGVRILHLHWVFGLTFAGSASSPLVRRLSQAWFTLVLLWCRVLGIRVVWTAHNVLPHDQVFHDDRAARARLLRSSSHVILHDAAVAQQLAELVGDASALPRMSVVPHGSFAGVAADAPDDRAAARAARGLPTDRRVLLFFGRVTTQKGAGDLVEAFGALRGRADAPVLVVAGSCTDDVLRRRLESAAERLGDRLVLDLRHLSDADLVAYLVAADVVVLPFRSVTTSGSALMALAQGRPVVVPDLPQLAGLPAAACLRYDAPDGLPWALERASALSAADLVASGEAGRAWSATAPGWPEAARRTAEVYRDVLDGRGRS